MTRPEKLLKKLNLQEKIGLLSQNIYGWQAVKNNGKDIHEKIINDELKKYGVIGSIYGLLRSDPWSKMDFEKGINASDSYEFVNKVADMIEGEQSIRPFIVEEAPHGHQALDSVVYPVNLASGSSFNPDLYKQIYRNISRELSFKGANIALVSCLDLALDPRWGRSEECYGEDAFLSMQYTKSLVEGVQESKQVGVVLKHFIAQGSALGGQNGGSVSMGQNELKTYNLSIVKEGIKSGAVGLMAAYNNIDGIPCHTNKALLTGWLREENNFEGFVMSDGCAIDNLPKLLNISEEEAISLSMQSGVDIDLWNESFNCLEDAIKNELINESKIDEKVLRILNAKEKLGLLDKQDKKPLINDEDIKKFNEDSYEMARESLILLKNEDILPLNSLEDTCLISPMGGDLYHFLGDYTPFIDIDKYNNLFEEFDIPCALGGELRKDDSEKLNNAIKVARENKKVILVLGSSSSRDFNVEFDKNGSARFANSMMDCGEGVDVAEIKISNSQQKLFDEIYKVNKNIITVIVSGRAVGIEEIARKSKAVIFGFYGGTHQPRAIKETILGMNNPSGRLPISIPKNSSQLPSYYWKTHSSNYIDHDGEPLYKFGEGLSYSEFEIGEKSVTKVDGSIFVTVNVKNNSNLNAKKTILVFGKLNGCLPIPPKELLVGFLKKEIRSNETVKFKIKINEEWLKDNFEYKDIEFTIK